MKPIWRGTCLLLLIGGLNTLDVSGQEVRRAIPVTPGSGTAPSPAATREPPTPPAVPFSYGEAPRQKPLVPTPVPTSTPAPPVIPQSTPTPADEGSVIRLAPGGGTEQVIDTAAVQLESANGFYSRKMYDVAIPEYEKYLIMVTTRGDATRQQALFRLAESQRFLGNMEAARDGYQRLLAEFQTGEYTGASAYRMGEMLYGEKNFNGALQMYRKAHANSADADVKLTARFYEARSLDSLKKRDEALPIYQEISEVKGKNPYRDFTLLYLADAAAEKGNKEQALAQFVALSASAEKQSLRAEAAFRGAAIAEELGQKEKARELYNKVAKSDQAELVGPAKLSALRMAYDLNDYKAVTTASLGAFDQMPGDALENAILLVANSYRQLGEHRKAAELYDRLLREFPNSKAAREANFHRLVSLYSLNDKNTLKEIDEFLLLTSNPKERNQAKLLKAELLFKEKKFAEAGKIYAELESADLGESFRADALYKLGWCQAHVQDYSGAAGTFTKFVQMYPKHEFVAAAIAQRALCAQQNKDYEAAIRDFDLLIAQYPGTHERELAMQQRALLFGQQQKNDEMAEAFENFLKEYPRSAAVAQANFWLGWAAFEKKDYPRAIEKLELARTQDAAQYADRATLRILMANYYQENRDGTAKEIGRLRKENIPPEILRWLGSKYIEDGNYAKAEQFLLPLTKLDASVPVSPEVFMDLAQAQMKQKKWKEAQAPINRYLSTARDPTSRARGLLAYAEVQVGLKKYEEAQKVIDEAMLLQPEGRWNAEARLLQAELSFAKSDYDAAARQFMTIALLYDDKDITPRALTRARDSFLRANNPVDADKALRELMQRYPDSNPQTKLSSQKAL